MTGSTADLRRSSRLTVSVRRRLWPKNIDLELVVGRGVLAAIAAVGDDAGKDRADLRLDLQDYGC
jgi:hypothetical protein